MAQRRSSNEKSKPAGFKIAGLPFTIRYDQQNLSDKEYAGGSRSLMGHSDIDSLEVSLRPGRPLPAERETMMHEVLHMLHGVAGFIHNGMPDDEEKYVRSMSPLILGFLRDNPAMAEYFLAED